MEGDTAQQTAELESSRNDESVDAKENSDYIRFWPFFKAIQEKDWKGVVDFVRKDKNNQALTSKFKFSSYEETIFHVITRNLNVPRRVLEKLASMVDPKALKLENRFGQSPLFMAALSGNIEAAKIFVERNKDLANKRSRDGFLPIQKAAKWGHKEVIRFLWTHTTKSLDDKREKKDKKSKEDNRNKKKGKRKQGVNLLKDLINCGLYDLAIKLLENYPKLAREENKDRGSILEMLASRPSAFKSGSQLGYWKRKIYEWIPVQEEHIPRPRSVHSDEEDPMDDRSNKLKKFKIFESIKRQISNAFGALFQILRITLWKSLVQVPGIKSLHSKKLKHTHALGIVRIMCHEGVIWTDKEASESLWLPLSSATRLGIYELVDEILKAYYFSYSLCDQKKPKHGILHIAIQHRQEEVFSLITNMNLFHWEWKAARKDKNTENFLHLAAMNVASSRVPGAALQMQRELQWFKAVETFVHPSLQEQCTGCGKTPQEMFNKEHKNLVKEGEQWMKDTATSCTVVAALIITVVFAAAFTVPGGNNTDGFPLFLHELPFLVFIVSDALALFFSSASVFMFLGILTSRYSQEDFLESLPWKLIIGLLSLLFSIAFMMIAFDAAIYILLSDLRSTAFFPIALISGLPVVSFARSQFPLLIEMYLSTYRSILYPRRK